MFTPRMLRDEDRPAYRRGLKRNFSERGEKTVNALFEKFNRELFEGRLPTCKVEIVRSLLGPRREVSEEVMSTRSQAYVDLRSGGFS